MRASRLLSFALLAGTLVLLGAVPLSADSSTLGAEGVLYTAKVGTYGSLFPQGSALSPDTHVVVLEISDAEGVRTRLLPPGGETVAPDATPFVLWENTSARLFMVWEGLSHIHSGVHLASFDGESWSVPLPISGNPFTKKSSPRLAITRESYARDVDGETVRSVRTMLHIVWYEDDYGDVHVLYAPLALDNGTVPDKLPPIFDLGQFVPATASAQGTASASLLRNPRVVAAGDQQGVLVALADDASDQLVTFRIDVLPMELSAVADALETFFAAEKEPCSGNVETLAERARAHLVVIGTRWSAYARSYLADTLRDWLLANRNGECSEGGRATLAERARAHLVVIGRRALREVLVGNESQITHLITFDGFAEGLHHDLTLSLEGTTSMPPALGQGEARIHIGATGEQSLVSWVEDDQLLYQEHDGETWLPRQSLALSDSFTLEQAYTLLDGKAR